MSWTWYLLASAARLSSAWLGSGQVILNFGVGEDGLSYLKRDISSPEIFSLHNWSQPATCNCQAIWCRQWFIRLPALISVQRISTRSTRSRAGNPKPNKMVSSSSFFSFANRIWEKIEEIAALFIESDVRHSAVTKQCGSVRGEAEWGGTTCR